MEAHYRTFKRSGFKMTTKNIILDSKYILKSSSKSIAGCAAKYFAALSGKEVKVISKINNFNNANTIKIEALCENFSSVELVSFWCSPYDLEPINKE